MAENSSGSWWSTLPGVLTGIAAVLTAGSGALIASHQVGLFGGSSPRSAVPSPAPGPPPAAAPGSTASRSPAAAAAALRLGDLTITVVNLRIVDSGGALSGELHYRVAMRDGVQRHDPREVARLVADGVVLEPVRASAPTMIGEGGSRHEALAVFRLERRPGAIVLRFQASEAMAEIPWPAATR